MLSNTLSNSADCREGRVLTEPVAIEAFMVEDAPFFSNLLMSASQHEPSSGGQLIRLAGGIHPDTVEPTGHVVSQRTNPDPRSIKLSSLSVLSRSFEGLALFIEAFVLALDTGPCLSQCFVSHSFTDVPEALGILAEDQTTGPTGMSDQAMPAKLIDRADLLD